METAMGVLNGKVAIVTGASKGIGASIATALGAAGASVVVNYSSSKEGADRAVAEITSKGGKAIAVQGDVSKNADVLRLFAETKKAFGQLDILVNNAGVFQFEPLETVTEDEFHREFNTNVLGPILLIQESLKHFSAVGGNVINISSVVSDNPPPHSVVYAATKGALDTITKVLSKEFGARNIRVNTIAPGGVDTEGARRRHRKRVRDTDGRRHAARTHWAARGHRSRRGLPRVGRIRLDHGREARRRRRLGVTRSRMVRG
jgi:3-oxoacyl-[acyl-carrier protein] reductase